MLPKEPHVVLWLTSQALMRITIVPMITLAFPWFSKPNLVPISFVERKLDQQLVDGPLIFMKKGSKLVQTEKFLVLIQFVCELEKNVLFLRFYSLIKLMKVMMITWKLNFQATSILHIKMVFKDQYLRLLFRLRPLATTQHFSRVRWTKISTKFMTMAFDTLGIA